MSAHMKKHPIKSSNKRSLGNAILYVQKGNKYYAIPMHVAEKYRVDTTSHSHNVPATELFDDLEQKFTKAGTLLRGLRHREGLTQKQFSEKIGVTQANLSNMENGKRPIGKAVAKRIEEAFGTNYRYFLE